MGYSTVLVNSHKDTSTFSDDETLLCEVLGDRNASRCRGVAILEERLG